MFTQYTHIILVACTVFVSVFVGAACPAAGQEYSDGPTQYQLTDLPATQPIVFATDQSNQADVSSGLVTEDKLSGSDDEKARKAAKKKRDALAKNVAKAHKAVFFDNDFSYLIQNPGSGCFFGDGLKNRCLPGGGTYDIGGQVRMRYHAERNMRGLGLTGVDDDFLLYRTRLYGDFRFSPNLRVYAEMIDAESNYENFGPRPIEVNRADMLNLFVDARLFANGDKSLTARVGRQELLYGVQRTISPLDWANTRRTFDGARFMYKTKDRSIDAFWTNFVTPNDHSFDAPNRDVEFMGVYSSYTGRKNQTTDVYFLRLLDRSGQNNFKYNTLGFRSQGSRSEFLWDIESAYQFGDNTDGTDHVAGMATFGIGRKMENRRWKPTVWAYYDYASGDDATGSGNGFHQMFPLAHKYIGFMDLFGRRNIEDANIQLTLHPKKNLKLLAWYHYLFLETKTDTPYSVVMTPFNGANIPGSADLGHEVDLIASYGITPRQNLMLGYSVFFSGDYYSTTPGVPYAGNAEFFYSQYSINF